MRSCVHACLRAFVCDTTRFISTATSVILITDLQCWTEYALVDDPYVGVPNNMITASSRYDASYATKNARFSTPRAAWRADQSEIDASINTEPNFYIQVRY